MRDFKEILGGIAVLSFALILSGSLLWVSAVQEAAAFNRLTTGPKVTNWDALWLDLRVEAQR